MGEGYFASMYPDILTFVNIILNNLVNHITMPLHISISLLEFHQSINFIKNLYKVPVMLIPADVPNKYK